MTEEEGTAVAGRKKLGLKIEIEYAAAYLIERE